MIYQDFGSFTSFSTLIDKIFLSVKAKISKYLLFSVHSELGSTDNYTSLYIVNEEHMGVLDEFPERLCVSKVRSTFQTFCAYINIK